MIRFYLCDVLPYDSTKWFRVAPCRPACHDILPGVVYSVIDDRLDETKGAVKAMLVRRDTDLAQHALLIADPRVQHVTRRTELSVRIRTRLLSMRWELGE